jgi:hypothetical protein
VAEAPTLDGDVLGDPAWKAAPVITSFFQEQPIEGAPSTEKTEVRMVFTKDTLFIGAVMYDAEPGGIVTADPRRDASLDDVDSFRMLVDTYRDRQNGFVFGTSAAGGEYDGQVTNEGQGGGGIAFGGTSAAGSGGGFNLNWDGAWTVPHEDLGRGLDGRVRHCSRRCVSGHARSDVGRELPAQHPPQERALMLGADSAAVQSPRVARRLGLGHQDAAVQSEDHAVRPRPDDHVGRRPAPPTTPRSSAATSSTRHAGADARCGEHRLRAGRGRRSAGEPRSLQPFLPEAAFFLENAGFSVGNQGEVDLFFSRRIGLSANGESVLRSSPAAACRARPANKHRSAQHADQRCGQPHREQQLRGGARQPRSAEPLAGRRAHHAAQATGDLAGTDDYGRTYALDGRWGIRQNTVVSGFFAKTDTPGRSGDEHRVQHPLAHQPAAHRRGRRLQEVGDT